MKVDLRSLDAWLHEHYTKFVPPEEGHGVQPTIDLLNDIVLASNRLVEAIERYEKVQGLPPQIIIEDPSL